MRPSHGTIFPAGAVSQGLGWSPRCSYTVEQTPGRLRRKLGTRERDSELASAIEICSATRVVNRMNRGNKPRLNPVRETRLVGRIHLVPAEGTAKYGVDQISRTLGPPRVEGYESLPTLEGKPATHTLTLAVWLI